MKLVDKLLGVTIVLAMAFFIYAVLSTERERRVAKLPGFYSEVDSLYVWARDKR